ncbi:MAG TPA: preprotein translocase subunit SecA [Candidatus Peribacteraceae bacterium]|nr:preprotein translocase subunit SecA [Candidatus Peribacteraceae bacterium]
MAFLDSLNKLLGDPNEKELKKLWPLVHQVREFQKRPEIQTLTKESLPAKTEELKAKIQAGATTGDVLTEAFAVAVRACELLQGETMTIGRQEFVWNMVPFDVQILGGIALHKGMIAEMKTGEGKTLVCTLPVYLNALTGKGVHVVTVNDYLARRDSTWMGLLYKTLGLTVGNVIHGISTEERREAYGSDITYGTNNEFGFDYLRDNMVSSRKQQVQRGLHYAIVDEVDSILIDEARTPLIISQPAEESTTKYMQYAQLVKGLQENVDYTKDEKQRVASLTEDGIKKMEKLLNVENIYTEKGFEEVHHIEQALRAYAIYERDVDYVVSSNNEIVIVDEFTGRLMPGRRYSYGLHQAIEAKENVPVQRESKTLATITFQNYFRLYDKLAGMTGTAKTEEEEFESIYKLRTLVVPTHRPMVRDDKPDAIYRSVSAKFKAVAKLAKEKHDKGQPVLIGTTSIEKSEVLGILLNQEGIPHEVLNAKNHEREAEIVAQAGQRGAVTIATNMAGRGTDIKLGDGVAELGGLAILGTERHESRRIDNQLRGRSGRQGDNGESQFFVSMEDDLMRLFGGDRLKTMMERLNVPEDVPLQNGMVSRSIEGAQKRVEGHHFDTRKHVLQYDNVMNKHREIIYKRRQNILEKIEESEEKNTQSEQLTLETMGTLHEDIVKSIRKEGRLIALTHAVGTDPDEWNWKQMTEDLAALHPQLRDLLPESALKQHTDPEKLGEFISDKLKEYYDLKCQQNGGPALAVQAENVVTLRSIDTHWMDHIDDMSHLREQVAFSGYAQRDPVIEYQDQGYRRFEELLGKIDSTIVRTILQIDFAQFAPRQVLEQAQQELQTISTNEAQIEGDLTQTGVGSRTRGILTEQDGGSGVIHSAMQRPQATAAPIQNNEKIGRNDPCPCGSGKKYKKCHGKDA